jgi:WD40 repeat protein
MSFPHEDSSPSDLPTEHLPEERGGEASDFQPEQRPPEAPTAPVPTVDGLHESGATDVGQTVSLPPPRAGEGEGAAIPLHSTSSSQDLGSPSVSVPGYQIEKELGRGGMGVVYRARHLQLNRTVALKMILAGGHAGQAELERFRVEAEAIARLQHPGIVQVFEVGEHEGMPFFSLEFCSQGSLEDHLEGTPLPSGEAAELLQSLAEAMYAAHEAQVIHRDLKPANVLLVPKVGAILPDRERPPVASLAAKITDFGLAKKLDEDTRTQTGAVLGTPSYMAPEQASGKRDIGPSIDIYALGAILYECLTGRPPFKAATSVDTVLQVLADEPVPPSHLNPGVPRDLETICLKCLRKEPDKRYTNAAALADDLGRWRRGEPVQARPTGRVERLLRWCRRNRTLTVVSGAAAVGLALVLLLSWWAAISARRAEASALDLAEEKAKVAAAERERLWESLVQQARGERDLGRRYQALERLKEAAAIKKTTALRGEAILAITSSGSRLVFEIPAEGSRLSEDKSLVAINGTTVKVWECATGRLLGRRVGIWFLDFRPGTKHLLVREKEAKKGRWTLILWDPEKGTDIARFTVPHPVSENAVCFNPDGTLLAVKDEDRVRVWDLNTKQEHKAFPADSAFFRIGLLGHLVRATTKQAPLQIPEGLKVVRRFPTSKRVLLRGKPKDQTKETMILWDLPTEKPLGHWPDTVRVPGATVSSADGRYLAFRDSVDLDTLRVWDWTTHCFCGRLGGNGNRGFALFLDAAFSADNVFLADVAAQGGLGTLRIWDVETGTELLSLPRTGVGTRVEFADGNLVARDVDTGTELLPPRRGDAGLAWVDGRRLVTYGPGRRGGPEIPNRGSITYFVSIGGRLFSALFHSSHFQIWEVTRPTPIYHLDGPIRSLSVNKDESQLAVHETLFRINKSPQEVTLQREIVGRGEIAVGFRGKEGIWGVQWYDVGTRKEYKAILHRTPPETVWREWNLPVLEYPVLEQKAREYLRKTHKAKAESVSYRPIQCVISPDGAKLLRSMDVQIKLHQEKTSIGFDNRFLECWDLEERKRLHLWRNSTFPLGPSWKGITISPDGRRVAVIKGGNIVLLDLSSGKEVIALGHRRAQQLDFSPDGLFLLGIEKGTSLKDGKPMIEGELGEPGTVAVYDTRNGREVRFWKTDVRSWGAVAISPGGHLLASGGQDRKIHLWDVKSGTVVMHWVADDTEITALRFSRDGKTLYSGSRGGTLKLWNLPYIRKELTAIGLDPTQGF